MSMAILLLLRKYWRMRSDSCKKIIAQKFRWKNSIKFGQGLCLSGFNFLNISKEYPSFWFHFFCFLFLLFGIRAIFDVGLVLLLLINSIGVYIGYLLVIKQLNIQSGYGDRICSLFKRSDCNNVLESDAAKLFGVFSWSEIGLGYFVTNVFFICLQPSYIPCLALINILGLPYTLWSIWYQKFRARQWCPLCLIVIILSWILFAINLISGFLFPSHITFLGLIITGFVCAISILSTAGIINNFKILCVWKS